MAKVVKAVAKLKVPVPKVAPPRVVPQVAPPAQPPPLVPQFEHIVPLARTLPPDERGGAGATILASTPPGGLRVGFNPKSWTPAVGQVPSGRPAFLQTRPPYPGIVRQVGISERAGLTTRGTYPGMWAQLEASGMGEAIRPPSERWEWYGALGTGEERFVGRTIAPGKPNLKVVPTFQKKGTWAGGATGGGGYGGSGGGGGYTEYTPPAAGFGRYLGLVNWRIGY